MLKTKQKQKKKDICDYKYILVSFNKRYNIYLWVLGTCTHTPCSKFEIKDYKLVKIKDQEKNY